MCSNMFDVGKIHHRNTFERCVTACCIRLRAWTDGPNFQAYEGLSLRLTLFVGDDAALLYDAAMTQAMIEEMNAYPAYWNAARLTSVFAGGSVSVLKIK